MPKLTNLTEVEAYLRTVSPEASDARKWQAVRVATHALLRSQNVPNPGAWTIKPLPPQAHSRYGDCTHWTRTIRYRKLHVTEWWITTLAHTICHEAAHAIVANERALQGKRGGGGHDPMWRGVMATLEYAGGRAHNLPPKERVMEFADD